tara:strand:- start:1302 stop:1562 length:261 start_codon:yes stop_codon:yes gene_type:complete
MNHSRKDDFASPLHQKEFEDEPGLTVQEETNDVQIPIYSRHSNGSGVERASSKASVSFAVDNELDGVASETGDSESSATDKTPLLQ